MNGDGWIGFIFVLVWAAMFWIAYRASQDFAVVNKRLDAIERRLK